MFGTDRRYALNVITRNTMAETGTYHLKVKESSGKALAELFDFDSPYQVDRVSTFLRKFKGKPIKVVISPTKRPKSREALGYYFGALVPATAMDTTGLKYHSETIYEDYKFWRSKGLISAKHLEVADTMLRLEWHYEYTRRIDGKVYRLPKDLAMQDNGALLDLINKVMEWRAENGYQHIDVEMYKTKRDDPELIDY